jgi:hypothetical protein
MKRIFSILFLLLVFLSGIHFSYDTHFCQGKIAATKFSFSGEKASCGMEKGNTTCPIKGKQINSSCCRDEINVYATDNNYIPSEFQTRKIAEDILQTFLMPAKHSLARLNISISAHTNTGPPGHHFIANIGLSGLCVFRI